VLDEEHEVRPVMRDLEGPELDYRRPAGVCSGRAWFDVPVADCGTLPGLLNSWSRGGRKRCDGSVYVRGLARQNK
jgi:hypothetical protein